MQNSASERTSSLKQSTISEMVDIIHDTYWDSEWIYSETDEFEIESQGRSRATGDYYYLVNVGGYYGIVRTDGRSEEIEEVSKDRRSTYLSFWCIVYSS